MPLPAVRCGATLGAFWLTRALLPSHLNPTLLPPTRRTAVPYPLLGENTLVLSDLLCVGPNEDGRPCLMCRRVAATACGNLIRSGEMRSPAFASQLLCQRLAGAPFCGRGPCNQALLHLAVSPPNLPPRAPWAVCVCRRVADTYPNQMLEITVRMYLYRWHQPTDGHPAFQQFHLEVSPSGWRGLLAGSRAGVLAWLVLLCTLACMHAGVLGAARLSAGCAAMAPDALAFLMTPRLLSFPCRSAGTRRARTGCTCACPSRCATPSQKVRGHQCRASARARAGGPGGRPAQGAVLPPLPASRLACLFGSLLGG